MSASRAQLPSFDPASLVEEKCTESDGNESLLVFEKVAADKGKLLNLKAAARLVDPEMSVDAFRKRLKRHGAQVIQFVPCGKIFLTMELVDKFIQRGKRRLRCS